MGGQHMLAGVERGAYLRETYLPAFEACVREAGAQETRRARKAFRAGGGVVGRAERREEDLRVGLVARELHPGQGGGKPDRLLV